MTKAFSIPVLLLCLQASSWCIDGPRAASPAAAESLAIGGLTDTLANLLAARPKSPLTRIGTGWVSLEGLVARDLPSLFKCDSAIQDYLGENASYEGLSRAIEDRLRESIGPYAFVEVGPYAVGEAYPPADDFLMRFAFELSLTRLVSVPVEIRSRNNGLSARFTVLGRVDLDFNADIFVDSKLVNEGDELRGCAVRIKRFDIALSLDSDRIDEAREVIDAPIDGAEAIPESSAEIATAYGGDEYHSVLSDANIQASIHYGLSKPAKGGPASDILASRVLSNDGPYGEDDPEILSYEDLSLGNYRWDVRENNLQSFTLAETTGDAISERPIAAREIRYSHDSLAEDWDRESLVFSDGVDRSETPDE